MAESSQFRYLAVDATGRRIRGALDAGDEGVAFETLRSRGLAPLSLRRASRPAAPAKVRSAPARESADFLASLADLLRAGADIRTALNILGGRSDRSPVKPLSKALSDAISSGEALDRAFAQSFKGSQSFVASMIAAGEASGDLPGGLQRAAEIFYARIKLRDQLISVLSYPAFVLVSAIAAVFVILLFIVPTIAPLALDSGTTPPPALAMLIAASNFLKANLTALEVLTLASVVLLAMAGRLGLLNGPLEAAVLDGPARRTVRGLVFGGFAISLGTMLSAGAPVTDALRLANRATMTKAARRRIEPMLQAVRQGQPLSAALETAKGFPPSIVRLAAVGEASNALGPMLLRGGKLEEDAAMRRIESFGRIAGPVLIVVLGLLLGALMGSVLSGVSQLGSSALN
ncbi:type II secretion system F family protein [Phenylobacterium sp.]|uniref:type II secretion system F family protein n=1 Tax=Phenylobacterium sp. TaxID=1871053 RepID=UPI002B891B15|nr:type II secretion system F family protein [Phenylobacterium sp.]HLZ77181.1 type II secretion system F family protein [Phenylobacterium sp.]